MDKRAKLNKKIKGLKDISIPSRLPSLKGLRKSTIIRWVKALRSGNYKQTIGGLQDERGFCCLGVACDIFIPKNRQHRKNSFLVGGMPDSQESSPVWLETISDDLNGRFKVGFDDLNDTFEFSFDEIADIIELVYIHKVVG